MLSREWRTSSVCTAGIIAPSAKPSRKRSTPSWVALVTKDMAISSSSDTTMVASRIRWVPIRSPSLPRRGAAISAEMPGSAAITPLRKAMLSAVGASSRTNSVRIGLTEPLHIWITMVVTNRQSMSLGLSSEANTSRPLSLSFLLTGV